MMIPAFPDNPCAGGAGTVTSVGITAPAIFAVTNSPVTTAGVIDLALVTQTANRVFAGPSTGAAAAPTFRTLVAADLGTGTPTVNTVLRGDLTWGDATAIVGWTPSLNTSSPNNTVNASRLLVNSTSVDGDAVIQPKGTGALLGSLPDGTAAGGNKRGQYAVDLQTSRVAASNVALGNYSGVLSGYSNTTNSVYSVVSGGSTNTINTTSQYSFIGGGFQNLINNNANYSVVSGGFNNQIGSGAASVILGGQNCTTTYDYNVASGNSATAYRHGQRAYGSYRINGSAPLQSEDQILIRETTNNTQVELTTNGLAPDYTTNVNVLTIADDSLYAFHGIIAARRSDANNEGAAWEIKGVVDRNSGTCALVGCPSIITLGDDSSGVWSISIDVTIPGQYLAFKVTGENAKTIYWAADIRLLRITA